MPTYCFNELKLIGSEEAIKEVFSYISTESPDGKKVLFDFNKIVPEPKELEADTIKWASANQSFASVIDRPVKEWTEEELKEYDAWFKGIGKRDEENIKKYGFKDIYEWRRNNWSTWYDPWDVIIKGNAIKFTTSAGQPYKLLLKLSKLFPEIKFINKFWDDSDYHTFCKNGYAEGFDIYFEQRFDLEAYKKDRPDYKEDMRENNETQDDKSIKSIEPDYLEDLPF